MFFGFEFVLICPFIINSSISIVHLNSLLNKRYQPPMDCEPDIIVIKQENQDLEYFSDVRVKVENDIEWSLQTALAPSENYQQDRILLGEIEKKNSQIDKARYNLAPTENYHDEITYSPSESYQNNINCEEVKQELQSVIGDRFIHHGKYQDIITYEELKEESSQTCMLCGTRFADSYSLLRHNLIHLEVPLINQKLFMCEHCPIYCKKKKDLLYHILFNHIRKYNPQIPITKQKHECLICNKMYLYKTWANHMKQVHCEAKFKCKKCNLMFKGKRSLKSHIIHVHEGVKRINKLQQTRGPLGCPQCPAILKCKSALNAHLRNCHNNKTHTCYICNSMLKCKSYLLTHMRRVHHNDGILHQCDICGKEFKSERYVKIHIKNSHVKKESQ